MAIFNEAYIEDRYGVESIIREYSNEVMNELAICDTVVCISERVDVIATVKNAFQRIIDSIKRFFEKFINAVKAKIAKIRGKDTKSQEQKNRDMTSEERTSGPTKFEPTRADVSRFNEDEVIEKLVDSDIKVYDFDEIKFDWSSDFKYDDKTPQEVSDANECEGAKRTAMLKGFYHDANAGYAIPKSIPSTEGINANYNKVMKFLNEKKNELEKDAGNIDSKEKIDLLTKKASDYYVWFLGNCISFNRDIDAYTKVCRIYTEMNK